MRFTFLLTTLFINGLLGIYTAPQAVCAKQIKYYVGTWQDLQIIALAEQKPIFVEIYAKEDNPKMPNHSLGDTTLVDFYNNNFVNYRVDINTKLGDYFKQNYLVNYASELLFFDKDGFLMYRKNANKNNKEELLQTAQLAVSRSLVTLDLMQKQFEQGFRSPLFLHDYAYKLQKKQLENATVVNEYIRQKRLQKRISKTEEMQFIYDFASNPKTEAFAVLCKNQLLFEKRYGSDLIHKQIESIALGNVMRAAHTNNEKLYLKMRKTIAQSQLPNAKDLLLLMESTYFNTTSTLNADL